MSLKVYHKIAWNIKLFLFNPRFRYSVCLYRGKGFNCDFKTTLLPSIRFGNKNQMFLSLLTNSVGAIYSKVSH